MRIELGDVVIRDFQQKDADHIYRIVREPGVVRFMGDWSENTEKRENLEEYIAWLQFQKDSTDVYENKRYAVALKDTDVMIGMVGMGLEDTVNEVEVAYFMSEQYQHKGYTQQAVEGLVNWCFQVSEVPYLILTIDCANVPSLKLAEKCGFTLFEKRTPIGHKQPNMESDSYYYLRRYRDKIVMNYQLHTDIRENEILRKSFNELTDQTFGFDFTGWYQAGHWGNQYVPHALTDGDRVISNVSVNFMTFLEQGSLRRYIQLGTVMTDKEYRGQGLNRYLMETVIQKYQNQAEGIYLFGNDDVLNYYPKFGFQPILEYEYSMKVSLGEEIIPYRIEHCNLSEGSCARELYHEIEKPMKRNPNDGFYQSHNLSLYQFWLESGYGEYVYKIPELEAYVVAKVKGETLSVFQIFGEEEVDIRRFAKSLDERITQICLEFTPAKTQDYQSQIHKEEDTTLFILGKDLHRIQELKYLFPVMSHA